MRVQRFKYIFFAFYNMPIIYYCYHVGTDITCRQKESRGIAITHGSINYYSISQQSSLIRLDYLIGLLTIVIRLVSQYSFILHLFLLFVYFQYKRFSTSLVIFYFLYFLQLVSIQYYLLVIKKFTFSIFLLYSIFSLIYRVDFCLFLL